MKFRKSAVLGAWALAVGALAVGCDQGAYSAQTCGGVPIPQNGCPLSDDDSECSDSCCAAAYTCESSQWVFEHTCPSYDGGANCRDANVGSSTVGGAGATICDAAEVDAPPGANGGTGCIDLEPPDCPVGEVLTCGAASCTELGCSSLFYCVGGEWVFWGGCGEDGGLMPAQ
jgi:hypothetical protein